MSDSSNKRAPDSSNTSTPMFSPSSAIDRFMALRRRNGLVSPSPPLQLSTLLQSSSPGSQTRTFDTTKRQKLDDPTSHNLAQLPSNLQQRVMNSSPKAKQDQKQGFGLTTPAIHSSTTQAFEASVSSPAVVRPYDPLPSPSQEIHRYIVSTRLLQNMTLVRALRDPECGRSQLIERDFEFLRGMLPESMQQDRTSSPEARVEADVILDEKNAVIFYPLCDIAKATVQDPNSGLSDLITTLARIGPRYKVIWLIFEEYSWSRPSVSCPRRFAPMEKSLASDPNVQQPTDFDTVTGRTTQPKGGAATTDATSTAKTTCATTSQSSLTSIPRQDPYLEPVMEQLNKFMAWKLFAGDRRMWLSKVGYGMASNGKRPGNPFTFVIEQASELKFETQVLYASDEHCAAWMTHTIGEVIVARIDSDVQAKIRREEDGWQSREEWVWRDWLNEQESTHERFLASFGLFNPFSIQLILSLCSLKEFVSMDHRQRVASVGKFIDSEILAVFDRVISVSFD
ncbi:hypothetical protein BGX31_005543 [Mortierella sp. GBA43]|nr:hypothetical protein BGX31_005543 [Mortierella sp. GBA43]